MRKRVMMLLCVLMILAALSHAEDNAFTEGAETTDLCSILNQADMAGEPVAAPVLEKAASIGPPTSKSMKTAQTNLVFIHHSCGENWLNDGLSKELNDKGYHVADICYGWREYGDHTDTSDWPMWFTDEVMELVCQELGAMTAQNSLPPAEGGNTVIMFKSCFPCSDAGDSIEDEQELYNGLLPYFMSRPDRMFILVTPPPMIKIEYPAKTRELCNWLTDRETGWLVGLVTGNVFVFDFYNVLTHPDAHHRMENGREIHVWVRGSDTLHYDSSGDDHPSRQGNLKATEEFIGLLERWHAQYSANDSF